MGHLICTLWYEQSRTPNQDVTESHPLCRMDLANTMKLVNYVLCSLVYRRTLCYPYTQARRRGRKKNTWFTLFAHALNYRQGHMAE